MARARVIEGTTEEIAALLQEGAFAGRKLRLIVDPEDEDLGEALSEPRGAVRDRAHLEALLLQGIASEKQDVTDQEWVDLRREMRNRLAQGNHQL